MDELVVRDEKGRLLPGSQLTIQASEPGKMIELKRAMRRALTPMQAYFIMNDMIEHCMNKDTPFKEKLEAANFIFDRCCGKPKQEIDLDVTQNTPTFDVAAVKESLRAGGLNVPD